MAIQRNRRKNNRNESNSSSNSTNRNRYRNQRNVNRNNYYDETDYDDEDELEDGSSSDNSSNSNNNSDKENKKNSNSQNEQNTNNNESVEDDEESEDSSDGEGKIKIKIPKALKIKLILVGIGAIAVFLLVLLLIAVFTSIFGGLDPTIPMAPELIDKCPTLTVDIYKKIPVNSTNSGNKSASSNKDSSNVFYDDNGVNNTSSSSGSTTNSIAKYKYELVKTVEVDFDTYIAGVIAGEVGEFSDSEDTMKALAIAARTYLMNRIEDSNSCRIESSDRVQVMIENPSQKFMDISKATSNMVLRDDNDVMLRYPEYDAFACVGKTIVDGVDYYIINQPATKHQLIPVAWVNKIPQRMLSDWLICDHLKHNNHGRGMSQYGAYYLATVEGYSYEEILLYYYEDYMDKNITNDDRMNASWYIGDCNNNCDFSDESLAGAFEELSGSLFDINEWQ